MYVMARVPNAATLLYSELDFLAFYILTWIYGIGNIIAWKEGPTVTVLGGINSESHSNLIYNYLLIEGCKK